MLQRFICLLIGYACGCVLCSDIVARALSGKSAFELGDGNPGMANVGHELGTKAALLSLAGDILKTVLAVVVSQLLYPQLGIVATAWAGLGTTLGHDFPFWHRFRGDKGVPPSQAPSSSSPLFGVYWQEWWDSSPSSLQAISVWQPLLPWHSMSSLCSHKAIWKYLVSASVLWHYKSTGIGPNS